MRSGTVMKTRFMVYESHLSYILQFLCDFGLYGCGWIDLVEVWQRGDEDEQDQEGHAVGLAFNPSSYYRQTRMPLEVDVAAHQILNRHQLSTRDIHHKLSIPAAPLPSEPLVISVRELWEDERRRRVSLGLSPTPEVPKELSESSRSLGAEWVAEARWWDEVQKRVQREKGREDVTPSTSGWDRWVMTTFESVEVLWEKPWRKWKPLQHNPQTGAAKPTDVSDANPYAIATGQSPQDLTGNDDVDVDEKMLSSQAVSKMVETEEVAWEKLLDEGVDDNDINLVDKEYAAAEDGPPPELQFDDTDSATGGDSPGSVRYILFGP